jgi:hypothetical protein
VTWEICDKSSLLCTPVQFPDEGTMASSITQDVTNITFCFVVLRTMEVKTSLDFLEYLESELPSIKTHREFWKTEHPQMQAFCLQNAYVIFFPVILQGYLPDTS